MFQLEALTNDFGYVEYFMPNGTITKRKWKLHASLYTDDYETFLKADKVIVFYPDGHNEVIKDRYNPYFI